MKTKMHKLLSMAVLGVTLQLQSLPAWAGLVKTPEVTIRHDNNTNGYAFVGAYGTMIGARYSADTQQYIGCYDSSIYSANEITCRATDKIGRTTYCYSSDPEYVAAVNAMTDSSYISFRTYPTIHGAPCIELIVDNSSSNLK